MKREWLGLGAAMAYPTLLAWFYFVFLAKTPALEIEQASGAAVSHNPAVVIAWFGGKALQFAFPLLWIRFVLRRPIPLSGPPFKGATLGVGFGMVGIFATFGLYFFLKSYTNVLDNAPARLHGKVGEFGLETPGLYILFVSFITVVHSFLEEYYWRWFVFGGLRCRLPLVAAILLSSVAFMAFHIIDLAVFFPRQFWLLAFPLSVCVGIGGGVWAWLYDRTGSIYAPWLSHLLIDAGIMAVGYDLLFNRG